VTKPAGSRSPGRTRHKWENIKMDLEDIAWDSMGWFSIWAGEHGNKPLGSIKCEEFLD
jgi:hypothetical protein